MIHQAPKWKPAQALVAPSAPKRNPVDIEAAGAKRMRLLQHVNQHGARKVVLALESALPAASMSTGLRFGADGATSACAGFHFGAWWIIYRASSASGRLAPRPAPRRPARSAVVEGGKQADKLRKLFKL